MKTPIVFVGRLLAADRASWLLIQLFRTMLIAHPLICVIDGLNIFRATWRPRRKTVQIELTVRLRWSVEFEPRDGPGKTVGYNN